MKKIILISSILLALLFLFGCVGVEERKIFSKEECESKGLECIQLEEGGTSTEKYVKVGEILEGEQFNYASLDNYNIACDEGLEPIHASIGYFEEIDNCAFVTSSMVCAKCGNGKCGVGEDRCNCPEDCELCPDGLCGPEEDASICPEDCQDACVKEGHSSRRFACCEGLTAVNKMEYEDGVCYNYSTEYNPSTCINCGDGICRQIEDTTMAVYLSGENKCNCPEDCGELPEGTEWKQMI